MNRQTWRKLIAIFIILLIAAVIVVGSVTVLKVREYATGDAFYDSLREGR